MQKKKTQNNKQNKKQTWYLLYIDSMGEFTTQNATNIQTTIFGTSYNKYVRPSAITSVGIELILLSINEMVCILFQILKVCRFLHL